jgi:uridine kinase
MLAISFNFYDYCLAGVFVEADEADIYQWRWEREKMKASPRSREEFDRVMKVYFDDFHQNIEYSKSNANFIIKKDSKHNYQLRYQQVDLRQAA